MGKGNSKKLIREKELSNNRCKMGAAANILIGIGLAIGIFFILFGSLLLTSVILNPAFNVFTDIIPIILGSVFVGVGIAFVVLIAGEL